MTIVDELKEIASMVGVTATGSTIYDVIRSFKTQLVAKQKKEAVAAKAAEPAPEKKPAKAEPKTDEAGFSFELPEEKKPRKRSSKASKE